MIKQNSLIEEVKTIYSEAETLKFLQRKIANEQDKSKGTLQEALNSNKILEYQNMFVRHVLDFAKRYNISNADIADMLKKQIGGTWQLDCEEASQTKLIAKYENLGVASRVLGEHKTEGKIELCSFWAPSHYKNLKKYSELKNLNWVVPYFLSVAECENSKENPLTPLTTIVQKNKLYFVIFNMLDHNLRSIAGVGAVSTIKR